MAILGVVVSHSSGCLWPLAQLPFAGPFISAMLTAVYPLGVLGVELFFVLSGFLIGTILINTFLQSVSFSFRDVKIFWIRRWFRTLPAYWLILTANIVLYKTMHMGGHTGEKLTYYLFLQNLWYPHLLSFFGEAWSLSVEEWFYITLPLFLLAAYQLAKPVSKQRFLLQAFVGYLFIFVIIRFANAFHPINGADRDAGIRKVVLFRLDAVMYGVIFAYLNYFKPTFLQKSSIYFLGVGLTGSAVMYWLLLHQQLTAGVPGNTANYFIGDAFQFLFIPLFFSMLLPSCNGIATFRGKIFGATMEHISKISYSLYLINYSLVYTLFFYPLKIQDPLLLTGSYLLYWFIIIIASSILYKYFEYPMMQLREKLSK